MNIISRKDAKSIGLIRYYTGIACLHGHVSERVVSSGACLRCKRKTDEPRIFFGPAEKREKWKLATRRKRSKIKQRLDESENKWNVVDPRKELLRNAKRRAKKLNRPFDITADDIIWSTHCPISDVLLEYHGHRDDNSASLDRVDNSKGYIKGNVRVISLRENMLKRDKTMDEIVRLYEYVMGIV